jgi:carbon-monoxide dehydrogenase medium subunit
LVLDSKLILKSLENEREVKLNKFFLSPGKTILEKNEILTEIIVPQPKEGSSAIYLKHGRRKCVDLAIVGVAVFILLDHRTQVCKDVRIALASVAPTPFRATQAEKIITNKKINESLIEECSQRALEMSRPVSDVYGEEWHKKELVKVLIRRAIRKAAALQGITI